MKELIELPRPVIQAFTRRNLLIAAFPLLSQTVDEKDCH